LLASVIVVDAGATSAVIAYRQLLGRHIRLKLLVMRRNMVGVHPLRGWALGDGRVKVVEKPFGLEAAFFFEIEAEVRA
jgi:hypothetical protein